MLLERRKFLKSLGIMALAANVPSLSLANVSPDFSAILHIVGGTNVSLGLPMAFEGLLLHQEGDGSSPFHAISSRGKELWTVTDNTLIQVPLNARLNRTTTEKINKPYIIRDIGGCRTGIVGLSFTDKDGEYKNGELTDKLSEMVEKVNMLKSKERCLQVFCFTTGAQLASFDNTRILQLIQQVCGVDQWFMSAQSNKGKHNHLKCLFDQYGNQVLVSINDKQSPCQQRMVYQSGRVSFVNSNLLT